MGQAEVFNRGPGNGHPGAACPQLGRTCGAMEWKSRLARMANCQASKPAYTAGGCQASPAAASRGTRSSGGSGSTLQPWD